MQQNQFPPGWDEKKVRELIEYHDRLMNDLIEADDADDEEWVSFEEEQFSLPELVADIHLLQKELEAFEQLYGVLSATFYEAYLDDDEPANPDWALDWAEWAMTYRTWLRRQAEYQYALQSFRAQVPSLSVVIQQTAQRSAMLQPLPV